MTPLIAEIHARSQRFHAEIARRASLVPRREDRTYSIPNTPYGVPKVKTAAPRVVKIDPVATFYHTMWFYNLVHCPLPSAGKRPLSIKDVQRATANHFAVSLTEMLSDRRTQPITSYRQIAMYLAKTLTTRSLPEIGRKFGGRDHTTVLHAVAKISALIETDPAIAADVKAISAQLTA